MNTFEPTGVAFEYGGARRPTASSDAGCADKGSFAPDGTIKITIAASKVGSPAVGQTLTAINADTVALVGGAGTGLLANVDTTSEGTYTLRACGVTSGTSERGQRHRDDASGRCDHDQRARERHAIRRTRR